MKHESGVTMVEYLLMVALIAIALVVAVVIFQGGVSDSFTKSTDCIESIKGGGGAQDCPGVNGN